MKERKFKIENIQSETKEEKIVSVILGRNWIPFVSQKIVHHPQGFYLIDFLIRKPYRIALEIDGWQHLSSRVDYDVKRTTFLELEECLKVIRFRNDEITDTPFFESILLQSLESNKQENRPLNIKEQLLYRRRGKFLKGVEKWDKRVSLTWPVDATAVSI